MDEQDVKIAVLQHEVQGLREQHKEHKAEMMTAITNLSNNVFEAVDALRVDVREIFEFINKAKGSAYFMVIGASVLGGTIAAVLPEIIHHFWR